MNKTKKKGCDGCPSQMPANVTDYLRRASPELYGDEEKKPCTQGNRYYESCPRRNREVK